MNNVKKCSTCGVVKPLAEFHKSRAGVKGVHQWCKECAAKYHKVYFKKNSEKFRNSVLKRDFGISSEIYYKMLAEQGGGCAICRRSPEENGKRLAVDHDHKCCPERSKSCGKCIRGLLCHHCNLALGALQDSTTLFKLAAEYIEKGSRKS